MQPIRRFFHHDNIQTRRFGLVLLVVCFLFIGQPAHAIEIADVPMATKIQKAPPNIMFVLDNSGSMDWSVMIEGTSNGTWGTSDNLWNNDFYVFDDPGDHLFSGYVITGVDRAEWKSQWSGVNKVYFNPQADYQPWPLSTQDSATDEIDRMPDADPTTPISNPYFLIDGDAGTDNVTLNMTDVYYTVPDAGNGVIVDNEDGAPFTTTGTWLPWTDSSAWNGTDVYTESPVLDNDTATFTPTIPSGFYDVYVWCACYGDSDTNTKVTVNHAGGIDEYFWNQLSDCEGWILVGTNYNFEAGNNVSITRHNGSTGSYTNADAVRFVETGQSIDGLDIYNAHYYTQEWDDANGNGDGIEDPDELTNYLVNFNSGAREVYRINDLNDNDIIDDTGELELIGNELPESIRPSIYDDNGDFDGYRSATNELQNFANWYSYYRKRELAAKAAVAEVIVNSTGIQLGFYSLHDNNSGATRQPVLTVRVPGQTDETSTLLSNLYEMDSNGGTPLRTALQNVGEYFDDTDGSDGGLGASSPYYAEEDGGACQHSFAIVMTDGFWNGTSPGVDNADGGMGAPYADTVWNTLADVAMYYYERDLSSLPNELPVKPTDCDQKSTQHMVTFSVSFGLSGTLDIDEAGPEGSTYKTDPCFLDDDTPTPAWPTIVADEATTIDDLWHAAVNGRGEFFSASNPQELVAALIDIFDVLLSTNASEAAFTIDGEVISSNTRVFGPSYDSSTWTGELKAIEFDADGNLPFDDEGNIPDDEILWKASEGLLSLDWDTDRNIVTIRDDTGNSVPFRWGSLSNNQKSLLIFEPSDPSNDDAVLQYIRGKNDISGFRVRMNTDFETENVLGDIVHSSPVLAGNTIFIGANDGMLHAFNANTGVERFAYIPNLVFENLAGLKEMTFEHKFFVDATPAVWPNVDGITLLVGGLGKGGKGYYALDVTNADTYDSSSSETDVANAVVKWEYPAPGSTDSDMGYSFSKPFIVKSNATGLSSSDGWVVIFGNGYNSDNGHASLYVLDAITGVEVKRLDIGVAGDNGVDNGLSTPALIDLDLDNKVDVVYAGDLKGNLWKFDLSNSSTSSWDVAFSGSALFQATGPATNNNPQPITTKPAVMEHPLRHGLMVLFGTGKFLGESDRIDTDKQTLYGIWDFSDSDNTEFLGAFNRTNDEVGNLSNIELLMQETVFQDDFLGNQSIVDTFGSDGTDGGLAVHLLRITSDFTANWAVNGDTPFPDPDPGAAEQAHVGWYFDLPILGERLTEDPLIREGIFIAVTMIPDSSYCSGGGWSIINEFDALDGSRPASPTFDVTGSTFGTILINESDKINLTALTGETGEGGITKWVASTGILKPSGGILHLSESSIVELPGDAPKREKKILSSSIGVIQEVIELAPRRGIAFWREH